MRLRRSIGQICRRIIWPAARRRTGCRCVRTISTPMPISSFGSERASPQSTPKRATWFSPTAAASPMIACCWQPAPSRCGFRSPVPTSRMSIRCARSLTETGAVLAVTLQDANTGDTTTIERTLIAAAEQMEQLTAEPAVTETISDKPLSEVVTDKGYHSNEKIVDLKELGIWTYISEPKRGRRNWTCKEAERE